MLGFAIIPRPPFHAEGYWLWGNGLALHLVLAYDPKEKAAQNIVAALRLKECMPRVDHMAFLVDDIDATKALLEEYNIYYFEDYPLADKSIRQVISPLCIANVFDAQLIIISSVYVDILFRS